ncbi:DNA transformation protein [Actinobacillus porcitonsillarum]|uniref:DNA transformation protein n=1 Tax=Actinobacillus porcitonsillarum TaxID=189834 RepID=A0A2U8FHZ8_9PAST|nr:TfoX/Sxy family DNA transformation protein [Actinobacillus porcitonsillarum]AWI50619.1 DNA transformation protein [Actinobacillus porcitonsillarum]
MQPVHQIRQTVNEIFNPIIGDIRIKTYFSYYGIFSDGFMFALYKDDHIYLRTNQETSADIQAVKGVFVLDDPKAGIHTKNFYALPISYILSSTQFPAWVTSILDELRQERTRKEEKLKTQIRSLTNLNMKIERILKRINIHNVDEFKQKGYLATFVDIIKQGDEGSDLLLYKLHGALEQKSVYSLTPEEKISLLQEANQALYDAGLRHRFHIPD